MDEHETLTFAMSLILFLHLIAMCLFTLVSVASLMLVIGKPLGKEFESTALVWVRAWSRVQEELRKPPKPPRFIKKDKDVQRPRLVNHTRSKRESN